MARYFLANNNNTFRFKDHSYCYLDHATGEWIPNAAVCDNFTLDGI
jgi:hypothetical protein